MVRKGPLQAAYLDLDILRVRDVYHLREPVRQLDCDLEQVADALLELHNGAVGLDGEVERAPPRGDGDRVEQVLDDQALEEVDLRRRGIRRSACRASRLVRLGSATALLGVLDEELQELETRDDPLLLARERLRNLCAVTGPVRFEEDSREPLSLFAASQADAQLRLADDLDALVGKAVLGRKDLVFEALGQRAVQLQEHPGDLGSNILVL